MSEQSSLVIALSAFIGIVFVLLLHFLLQEGSAGILIGKGSELPPYPFSVQNLMWVFFFVGLGELMLRYLQGQLEMAQLSAGLLPESHDVVLTERDMPTIYENVVSQRGADYCVLPRMIRRTVLQFQSTKSIEQSSTVLSSSLDLFMHEIELRYTLVRYIVWLIPSLGFIGTVIGIALALNYAGQPGVQGAENLLEEVTKRLAVAFNTTLLALVLATVLVYLQSFFQAREESAINQSGQYCLDNLINKLYVRSE